jgi:hypothetical protein
MSVKNNTITPANTEERSKLDMRAGDTIRVWQKVKEKTVEVAKKTYETQQELDKYVRKNWLPVALITVGVVGLAVTTIMYINNKNSLKGIKL